MTSPRNDEISSVNNGIYKHGKDDEQSVTLFETL